MKLTKVKELPNSKKKYIYYLQHKGILRTYVLDNYQAYSEDEYQRYKQSVHRGRPITSKGKVYYTAKGE